VEAQNAAALGLYRSVGLEVEHEWRIYATAPNEPSGARKPGAAPMP
jgi:ribosomal protein S18 acetylase RimI-like enzyme